MYNETGGGDFDGLEHLLSEKSGVFGAKGSKMGQKWLVYIDFDHYFH